MKRKCMGILVLAAFICTAVLLATGCNRASEATASGVTKSSHEALTLDMPYKDIDAFIDKVHEKYPEINIDPIPYVGQNTTGWMRAMLKSGELPDIYFTTQYSPEVDEVSDKLLDLSSLPCTDQYVQARLRDVTVDGAVYMLPLSYGCIGITYNKTLLEKNGWTLPKSLKEMEELKPKVEAAGYTFCVDLMQYPGYGFQYLCNILDTGFLSTSDGLRWQHDYLSKTANVSSTPKMLENMQLLARWKELGLLTSAHSDAADADTRAFYKEGNTLFCLGNTNDISKEDGTDEYKLMPYLSEDGDQNVFILNVNRYVGLNKKLGDAGNEQKLEDAKHVLEVLSTEEGMWALNDQRGSALLPLESADVEPSSYYSEALDDLNHGHTAPFIYAGWDDVIVPIGNTMLDYIRNEATLQDVIDCIDENQSTLDKGEVFTTVTKTLDTEHCARMVGLCFAQASGADVALISEGAYHPKTHNTNPDGVYGSLFALPVKEQEIVTILPTGWDGHIETVTLSGARVKELAKDGYDRSGEGDTFPYVLVTKEGMTLEDTKNYKVAICGAAEEVQKEGKMQDSGIVGLDAMKDYLRTFDAISPENLVWK